MFYPHRSGAAAFGRPDMPHTLRSPTGGDIPQNLPRRHLRRLALRVSVDFAETFLAATARPFTGAQGHAYATGTRWLRPVTPASLLFAGKEVKQEKRRQLRNRLFGVRVANNQATAILRHKPSMRPFFAAAKNMKRGRRRMPIPQTARCLNRIYKTYGTYMPQYALSRPLVCVF